MSMICELLGLSPAQIDALHAAPQLAGDLANVAHDEAYARERADFRSRMPPDKRAEFEVEDRASEEIPEVKEAKRRIAEAAARIERLRPIEELLDLGKSWHMLHYLFTGHVYSLERAPGDALMTGQSLGDDVGYGPARLHNPDETRQFARFLSAQNVEHLKRRVNYREMLGLQVYAMPSGGQTPDAQHEAELRQEVGFYFPLLRDYVVGMASKQNGLLIWIS